MVSEAPASKIDQKIATLSEEVREKPSLAMNTPLSKDAPIQHENDSATGTPKGIALPKGKIREPIPPQDNISTLTTKPQEPIMTASPVSSTETTGALLHATG